MHPSSSNDKENHVCGICMKSTNPRKQRKSYFNAPLHKKRKQLASHLDEALLLKYDRRQLPVITGDTVRVMRGQFKGHEDKINQVNIKKQTVHVEGVVLTKADGKKIAKPIHASALLITKLNLTDQWRRKTLEKGLSEQTKKEIEAEAATQIKEYEAEQKRLQEEQERARAEQEAEEEEEEETQAPANQEKKQAPTKKKEEKPASTEPKKTAKKPSSKGKQDNASTTKKKNASSTAKKSSATKSSSSAKKKPTPKKSTSKPKDSSSKTKKKSEESS